MNDFRDQGTILNKIENPEIERKLNYSNYLDYKYLNH